MKSAMIVTQIEEFTKSKSKVYIDQELAFVLYKGELRIYGIEQGKEVSTSVYRQILGEVLPKRAKLRSMHLLKARDYTCAQLRDKLCRDLYPEAVIEEAIAYLLSFRYLDDARYALDYIRCYHDRKSRVRLEADLRRKGVAKDVVETAWQSWREEGNEQDETDQIRRLAEKRHFDARTADRKAWGNFYSFLLRRGFSAESIRKAMKNHLYDDFYLT